ncbi:hypothetical protein Q8A67_024489 [Cirrhinus molitorella]|uniref:Uncharacterized protein n=1 Tax=Cirrhinus molitorella TaxID=172907 RepID=A0AA88NYL3_9TELE|nr:hypothetical protein Q8A67_024489 [Cirrhinus molitorella]
MQHFVAQLRHVAWFSSCDQSHVMSSGVRPQRPVVSTVRQEERWEFLVPSHLACQAAARLMLRIDSLHLHSSRDALEVALRTLRAQADEKEAKQSRLKHFPVPVCICKRVNEPQGHSATLYGAILHCSSPFLIGWEDS